MININNIKVRARDSFPLRCRLSKAQMFLMNKTEYMKPAIRVKVIDSSWLMETSPEMPFNPGDGTGDALAGEGSFDADAETPEPRSVWDD